MKSISEIKQEEETKISELIKNCSVFFAFSKKQFEEGMTPLQDGEKYNRIPGGGFIPESKFKDFMGGLDAIEEWYKAQVVENNVRRDLIAYELENYEAYYTGCIESTLEALGDDFTPEEVVQVYNEEIINHK